METLKKPLIVTLFVILVMRNVSLTRTEKSENENEKITYIVHVAKSKMPTSFNHHSIWYESILKSASKSAEMLYTYNNAINGFSTSLRVEELQLLKSQVGVLKVTQDKMYKLFTTRTPEFLGLDKIASTFPTTNKSNDVIIGILDSGVWPESKSFDDSGYEPIPNTWKGKCEIGTNFTTSNCNKKLIGARFYSKGFEAFMGSINEINESRSPRDDIGHGTHTASIAAGSPVGNANFFGYANGTARGMAVGARVAVYKVCWNTGVCMGSDMLAAMDQAIADNVNVLSLSLGGLPIPYFKDEVAIGAFAAMEHGIFVSCAAGNRDFFHYSVTNVAPWITTVGSGTLDRDFPAYVNLGNGKKYSGASFYNGSSLPDTLLPFIYAGNASNYGVKGLGTCLPGSLDPKKVFGKIVLCDSGKISGIEKGNIVKSAGGLGMVLANTKGLQYTVADAHFMPAINVDFKDGEAIKKYLFSDPKPMGTIVFQGTRIGVEPSPVVAQTSLRGPNFITPQILKPDLIAPGVNILAAFTRNSSPTFEDSDPRRVDFNILTGTSMACPHVSGLAALIKSVHPEWSPAAIRSALMTTAYTTYKNNQTILDGATKNPATPFDFGAGHVEPVSALNPGLVYDLTVEDYLSFLCALNYSTTNIEIVARRKYACDPKKQYNVTNLNYPSFVVVFQSGHSVEEIKYTRTLTNVGAAGTYKVSVKSDDPSIKILIEPEVLSFKTNEKKLYTVTFMTSGSKPNNTRSFGRLEWSNGKIIVTSPIAFIWKLH